VEAEVAALIFLVALMEAPADREVRLDQAEAQVLPEDIISEARAEATAERADLIQVTTARVMQEAMEAYRAEAEAADQEATPMVVLLVVPTLADQEGLVPQAESCLPGNK
jgi:hypothetical protein